jgi:Chemotaxis protein; stimulates methylation of MCP proteins
VEDQKTYFLQPGFIFASQEPYLIHTVLGSCIAVCLWDSVHKFGGMCHYIYSTIQNQERNGKYGDVAIPHLFKLMFELGSQKSFLKAHIIGGGENPNFRSPVGNDNAALADKLVKQYAIDILTQDVNGQFGRKVIFNSGSGEILVYKINDVRREDWYNK